MNVLRNQLLLDRRQMFKVVSVLQKKTIQNAMLRQFSSSSSLVETKTEEGNNVANLILNRPPVNSLSLEMCTEISNALKELEAKKEIQAVILRSSNPAILSAGLDLTELYNPNKERFEQFWTSFQQVFLDLYGSRLAVIGAIEGHAPAAGCMLAMACDYRIMAASHGDKFGTIGLNEAQFGIAAPPWLGQLMIRTIGFRQAEEALTLGTLYSPEAALDIGLVDKLVHKDMVLGTSQDVAAKFAKIPPQARVASKMLARKEYLDELIMSRDSDTSHARDFICSDVVQAGLGKYLASLKRK